MKKHVLLLSLLVLALVQNNWAQTTEELQAMKDAKSTELAKLEADLAAITGQVDARSKAK
ncbi:MAG: hypothetical protein R2795_12960 [Saprospiraceae bacterium]